MIDTTLLDKYNQAVPRYTSYPPANFFYDGFSEQDYYALVASSNTGSPNHIAFYIHIPFCKKICFYCGCNACAMQKNDIVKEYIDALKTEIELVTEKLDPTLKISQMHFGGGTPNSIPSVFLDEIVSLLLSKFDTIENPEIAIECNPAYLDAGYIHSLLNIGFNRFSLGIQDFNNDVLKAVNRDPTSMPLNDIISQIKQFNSANAVNLDFIYGLPLQSVPSFLDTLNKAVELHPDRLVTFSYAHVPWMKKNQKILEKKGLPSPELKMNMFLSGYELLKNAGYIPLGLDHFVLPKDELNIARDQNLLHRNFQGYCTKRTTGQVYAFGVSAISQLEDGYAQNTKELKEYTEMLKRRKLPVIKGYKTSESEKVIRNVVNEVMCNMTVNWNNLADEWGMNASQLKSHIRLDDKELTEFQKDGILTFTDNNIEITEKGAFYVRNIAASLDPAFKKQENKYSKTV